MDGSGKRERENGRKRKVCGGSSAVGVKLCDRKTEIKEEKQRKERRCLDRDRDKDGENWRKLEEREMSTVQP